MRRPLGALLALLLLLVFLVVGWIAFAEGGEMVGPAPAGAPARADTSPDREAAPGDPVRSATAHEPRSVGGTVVRADGGAWGDGLVHLRRVKVGDYDEEVTLALAAVRTDGGGGFAFHGVAPGPSVLELRVDDEVRLQRRLLVPRDGDLALVLPAAAPAPLGSDPGPAPSGRGEVAVTVLDPRGVPAPGVAVGLFTAPNRRPVRARTDRRGQCRFTGLPACAFVLAAEHPALGCTPVLAEAVPWLQPVVFREHSSLLDEGEAATRFVKLQEWARIGGVAVDAADRPLPGARLALRGAGGMQSRDLTCDQLGNFASVLLPGTAYRLNELDTGFERVRSGATPFPGLTAGAERLDHRIVCRSPVPVRLRVVDPRGGPVAGAVVVSCEPPGIHFSSRTQDYMVGSIAPVRSDGDGRVRFAAWPGAYFLLYVHAAGRRSATVFFDLRGLGGAVIPDRVEREVVLPDPGVGVVRGAVVGPDGAPVEGARIRVAVGANPPHAVFAEAMADLKPWQRIDTVSGEDGGFALAGLDTDRDYELRCAHETWQEQVIPGVRAGAVGLRVVLAPPQAIRGRVVGPDGTGVPEVELELDAERTRSDREGGFALRRRRSGAASLYARGAGYFPAVLSLTGKEGGELRVALQPRPLLEGFLLGPDGQPLKLQQIDAWFRGAGREFLSERVRLATDELGRYRIHWPGYRPNRTPCRVVVDPGSLPDGSWCRILAERLDPTAPPQELRFRPGGRATVRVVDGAGRPIPGMCLLSGAEARVSDPDPQGRFRVWGFGGPAVELGLHGDYETLEGQRRIEVRAGVEATIRVRRRGVR